jgi:hypothetical protein
MLGHTAAWNVSSLSRSAFDDLKQRLRIDPALETAIARHQLDMAIRLTNQRLGSRLRRIGRQVVDASEEHTASFPIAACAGRRYHLERDLFTPDGSKFLLGRLRRDLAKVRSRVHSTIVAGVVRRHVTGPLMGVALRAHGGVYFVAKRREEGLLRLEHILEEGEVGRLTRIRVMGDARETALLTDEIQRLVREKTEVLREALTGPVPDPDAAARAAAKVKAAREELSAMREVFAFAAAAIEAEDRAARSLLHSKMLRSTTLAGSERLSSNGERGSA